MKLRLVKIFTLLLCCFLYADNAVAQAGSKEYGKIAVTITKQKKPKQIFTSIQIVDSFLNGDSVWVKKLESKIGQSTSFGKGAPPGTYIVYAQFLISPDGTIHDVKALTTNGYGMEAEVIRALKGNSKWEPSPGGSPVRDYRR